MTFIMRFNFQGRPTESFWNIQNPRKPSTLRSHAKRKKVQGQSGLLLMCGKAGLGGSFWAETFMKGRSCVAAGSSESGFMSQWEQLLSMLPHVLKDSKNPTVAGARGGTRRSDGNRRLQAWQMCSPAWKSYTRRFRKLWIQLLNIVIITT